MEYLELQTLLFSHWDDYNKMIDSSADLLQNCAELYLEYNQVRCDADLEDPREEELEEGPVEENEEERRFCKAFGSRFLCVCINHRKSSLS